MSNKFLSLAWFKSKIENAVEKVVASKIDHLIEQIDEESSENDVNRKPYLNIKLVNDVLTIVLNDGNIITKSDASQDDFIRAKQAKTENDLFNIVASSEVVCEKQAREAEIKRAKALKNGIDVLKQVDDFEVKDGSVYLKGINRSMPQLLVEKFIEIVSEYLNGTPYVDVLGLSTDENYLAHKRFFMWCCLNPRAEVAHELYRFLTENSFRITKQGFFAALRNVVTLHGSNELVQFVSNAYNKVKAVWKKSPDDYTVFLENGEYKLVHNSDLFETKVVECDECGGTGEIWDEEPSEEYGDDPGYVTCTVCDGDGTYEASVPVEHGQEIGKLTDLYLDLPNRHENRFTDDWTKTFDIRIGRVVSMPKEQCNWSTQDCAAAGLHFTADQIHYVGCGDTSVLVLINPMKVVGIGQHKGRCYEYLPIMTVPRDEATEILHDVNFDTLQLDDSFAVRELNNLEEFAKEGFAVESKKYDFNIPHISAMEIKNIVLQLDEMKNELSKRVVKID